MIFLIISELLEREYYSTGEGTSQKFGSLFYKLAIYFSLLSLDTIFVIRDNSFYVSDVLAGYYYV